MAYGTVKVDNIIFDNGGSDQNVTVSGLYRATTSGVTVSGTIAATTVSGVTVIGSTTVSGATVTGTTANFTSGNFGNIISSAATMSGALIMANQQQVRFREAVGNGVNHIALQAPAVVSADQTITLPDQTGTVITTGDNGSVSSTMLAANLTISAAAGSASTPSIAFTGDLNTGIYSPGADQLAVSTGGAGRLFIDSSGRVGIGTSTPDVALDAVGGIRGQALDATGTPALFSSAGGAVLSYSGAGVGVLRAYSDAGGAAGVLTFNASGSENVRIDNSGNVGIGLTPATKLDIQAGTTTSSSFGLRVAAGTNASDYSARFNNAAGTFLAGIDGSGNVGIGTSSPATLLDISVTEGMARIGGGSGNNLIQAYTGAVGIGMWAGGSPRFYSTGSMIFSVNSTVGTSAPTGYVDAMTIDSSGRVGIGTSSPWTPGVLDCFGNAKFGASSINGLYVGITSGIPYIQGYDSTTPSSSALAFYTGSSEAMRLDGSGNVGIGTSLPGKPLDVRGTGSVNVGSFSNGNQGIDIATTASGGSIQTFDQNQTLDLKTFGTTTNSINFSVGNTERLRIDSSGRLLVGTSSASGGYLNNNSLVHVQAEGPSAGITIHRPTTFSALAGPYLLFSRSRGTPAVIVNSGDNLGSIEWGGADGTDVESVAAAIRAEVDGTPGANDMPGRLVFSTTADGAANPTERLRIDSSGNVGIGTSIPSAKLHVVGSAGTNFGVSDGSAYGLRIDNGIAYGLTGSTIHGVDQTFFGSYQPLTLNGSQLGFAIGGTERLRIDSSGRVGIGTSSPAGRLHVNGGDSLFGSGSLIRLLSGGEVIDFANGAQDAYVNGRISGSTLKLYGNNGSGIDIDSSGNVGIGTSSPAARLHVISSEAQIESQTTSDGFLRFTNTSGSMSIGMSGAPTNALLIADRTNNQVAYTYNGGASGSHIWATNNIERLRIDSSGRVGIGTSSPAHKLDVAGGVNSTGLNVTGFGGFFNAANKFGVDNNAGTTRMYSSGPDASTRGSYDFRATDSVGTLDTSRMVIDSSGNVGIGTSSPAATLDVNGDVKLVSLNGGPLAGFRNRIINGNFDIWQRGTSFTGNEYGADRWTHNRVGTTHTATRQPFTLGQTDVPNEPTYYCRTVVSSVAGASNFSALVQFIEDVRTFAGQQVTVSFWAKVDSTKDIAIELQQNFGTGGSPSAPVQGIGSTKVSIGTSWQKVTVTATVPSISGKTLGTDVNNYLGLTIFFDAGSDFNARTDSLGQQSGTFDIAQVQIEPGSVATPFERRSIGTELALCQRYYCEQMAHAQSPVVGFMSTPVYFPVEMRAVPTQINVSPGSIVTASAISLTPSSTTSAWFQMQATSNGGYILNRLDAYSAEL